MNLTKEGPTVGSLIQNSQNESVKLEFNKIYDDENDQTKGVI